MNPYTIEAQNAKRRQAALKRGNPDNTNQWPNDGNMEPMVVRRPRTGSDPLPTPIPPSSVIYRSPIKTDAGSNMPPFSAAERENMLRTTTRPMPQPTQRPGFAQPGTSGTATQTASTPAAAMEPASAQPTPKPAAAMPDDFRLRMERGDIYRQRQAVLQELVNMGPEYLDRRDPTGERARRRAELIARRQQMERTGSALTAAMTPAPTVNPAQAAAARTDLERRTGVTVQTPAERALTMAMGAESSDPSSLRASAREQALPFETMEYQRRREAADQRRADAQRFLTTPIPGAEAPLAAMERQRVEANQDRESDRAVQLATQEARIRALKRVGEPEPMEAAQVRRTNAETGLIEAETGRRINDINNPNAPENVQRAISQTEGSRQLALSKSGYDSMRVIQDAQAIMPRINEFILSSGSLNRGNVDAGLSLDAGKGVEAVEQLRSIVLSPLSEYAKYDPQTAAQEASRLLSLLPQPGSDQQYHIAGFVNRLSPSIRSFTTGINDIRQQLRRIASYAPQESTAKQS